MADLSFAPLVVQRPIKAVAPIAGVGCGECPTLSLHAALKVAGVEHLNFIPVTSILPLDVEFLTSPPSLSPATLQPCILSLQTTDQFPALLHTALAILPQDRYLLVVEADMKTDHQGPVNEHTVSDAAEAWRKKVREIVREKYIALFITTVLVAPTSYNSIRGLVYHHSQTPKNSRYYLHPFNFYIKTPSTPVYCTCLTALLLYGEVENR